MHFVPLLPGCNVIAARAGHLQMRWRTLTLGDFEPYP
jgi:hypothetical protein